MCAALCCVCIPLEDRALLLSYFPSFYSSRLSSLRTWRFFFLLPAHKPRTNATPTNKLEDKMKRIFRSEGSDVAAQQRSRVYVCVCAQGLGAAYRFEQFRPTKIQIDSTLGWEISSAHKHTHTHATRTRLYVYGHIRGQWQPALKITFTQERSCTCRIQILQRTHLFSQRYLQPRAKWCNVITKNHCKPDYPGSYLNKNYINVLNGWIICFLTNWRISWHNPPPTPAADQIFHY